MPPHAPARPPRRPPAHARQASTTAPRHQLAARTATIAGLSVVAVAVLWPSGKEVSDIKDTIGPWFLDLEDKDIVLNLVMLAPVTFCACLGWRRTPWWVWALIGCAVGAAAESAQWMMPGLERRPLLSNALENSAGAWAGALLAAAVLHSQRRSERRSARRPPPPAQHVPAAGPWSFPGT